MKRYQYTCKLLSDIVISSVTATEGFNPSLDYIPGAKFLGIAARTLYDEGKAATLDIFHNGKVRFGDANPLINGQVGMPVPFSWFHEKGKRLTEPPIYLHHQLQDEDFKQLTAAGKQLKQARKGYFSANGTHMVVEQDFAIRSAYNREELRADDGQMFGYFSLQQGSTWTFVVEDDTELYADQIKAVLTGKKRVGRSRSAEYGLVEIEFDQERNIEHTTVPASEMTLVYALSNLCFYDDHGRPTLTPTAAQLGIPGGKILWRKSQIRSRLYQTWNRQRHNRDTDRMIIEKGSVFAIKHDQPIDTAAYASGVGSHRTEGFGRVLFNPEFLLSEGRELGMVLTKPSQPASDKDKRPVSQPSAQDKLVVAFLEQRQSEKAGAFDLNKKINDFVTSHGPLFHGIRASQWGTIRAYAKHAVNWNVLNKLLFDKDFGALYRGQSEADWREKKRREKLSDFLNTVEETDRALFTLKLAAEMAKRKNAKETA